MPGFDKTGPMGAGSMTGWGRGLSARRGDNYAAYGRGPGAGWGGRYGRGRGRRAGAGFGGRGFGPSVQGGGPMAAADRLELLKAEADNLKTALNTINK